VDKNRSLRETVDPQLLNLLDAFGDLGLHDNPVSDQTLGFYRNVMAQQYKDAPPPDASGIAMSELAFPSTDKTSITRALVYRPAPKIEPTGLILYIHGGGFVLGAPEQHQSRCCRMARSLGMTVVAPAYRLAPENPFPSGLDDCYGCLEAALVQADDLGVDPQRVAVFGESAGGGLAAALVQRALIEGGPAIAFQALHCPMLDPRTGGKKMKTDDRCGAFVWTRQSNRYAWSAYLGDADPETEPFAAPALANDLSGLPPCFLSTASLDLFLDENITYARRLLAFGVQTELVVYPGTYHAFDQAKEAAIAQKFEADLLAAIIRGLRPGPKMPISQ
jgi:acetyl esterase/lipase